MIKLKLCLCRGMMVFIFCEDFFCCSFLVKPDHWNGMQCPSSTGIFTSRYDWAWKGQNVRLSGKAFKNNLEEMVGFHSGEVERQGEGRGQQWMNN